MNNMYRHRRKVPNNAGGRATKQINDQRQPNPSGLTPVSRLVLLASTRYTIFAIRPGIHKKK
jgi:hypothetical protein